MSDKLLNKTGLAYYTGKVKAITDGLDERITNLSSLGRYLSNWSCVTGLAGTNPPQSPFAYRSGDYFLVSDVAASGGTNYKPSGSSYTIGVPSTVVETESVLAGDRYLYDGTVWALQKVAERVVSFSNVAGDPYDNTNLKNALDAKQANISDLDDIREGAGKGETALQPNDNISELTNDSGFITSSALSGYATETYVNNHHDTTKQDTLVSGTNIKTINNTSILGTGDISVATAEQGTKADNALPNTTKYAKSISYSGSTLTLRDQDGTSLSTATINGLVNTGTGSNALGIGDNSGAAGAGAIAIGSGSASHHGGAKANQRLSIAIGGNNGDTVSTSANAVGAIQLGIGGNSTAGTLSIGLTDGSSYNNYRLLNLDGKIPNERIPDLSSTYQTTISDLDTIRLNATAGKSASDTILTYGNIVTHNANEFATSAQGAKADTAVQPGDLATVATTGSYNDLSNTPTIPTKTSDLTNDSGFITSSYHDDTKQNVTDNTLETTAKTIVGAINELNSKPGITALSGLTDVTITNPTQGQNLTYDATLNKWKNATVTQTVNWGEINGNLSNQTDLSTVLNNKVEYAMVIRE